ncbi:MFS transporter [Erythrobacter sp. NFXS35]|uniref:MFS transporter n=1 Tax=Erythrobacter sp. NFXS35 TaxID=2818436 RepID=UPI0032E038A8
MDRATEGNGVRACKDRRVSLSQRATYGLGDFGFNLYWTTVGFYVLYFYTDVLGLSGKAAGLIFLIAMLWDGITDPVMGYLAQRTRTRWGSYRPYLLFGAVPLAASLVLVFSDPGLEGVSLAGFTLFAHMLFRTAYTAVNIPYSSLSARMTRSSEDRNRLAAWRISLATLGSAFVAYSTLRLVDHFGNGDPSLGFAMTAGLYAALSLPIFLVVFLVLREPVSEIRHVASSDLGQALSTLRRNTPFFIIMTAMFFATIGGVITSKLLVYYFKYTVGNEEAVGTLFATNSLMILLAVPVLSFITRRSSKRRVWQMGAIISITGSILLYANPFETVTVVICIAAFGAIGSAAGYLTFWSALPDTVEYGEMQSGKREESLTFGVMSFTQKASYGVGAALSGLLLDGIGYSANGTQSAETIEMLKTLMTLLPAGLVAIAFLIIAKYRLDVEAHRRVVGIIDARARRHKSRKVGHAVPLQLPADGSTS